MARDPNALANARRHRLLALLSDGAFHSGEKLAKRLRISRAGVWKIVSGLRELGLDIESIPRQGYRLPRAVDLYVKDAIERAAAPQVRSALLRDEGAEYLPWLQLVEAYEEAKWQEVARLSEALRLDPTSIPDRYLEALQWTNDALADMDGDEAKPARARPS